MARRKQQNWRIPIIGAVVVIGTLIAMFAIPPEELRVRSADARLFIEGEARSQTRVRIDVRNDLAGPFSVVTGPVYEIMVDGEVSPLPFRLTFTDQPGRVLYRTDAATGSWEAIPSVRDEATGRFETELVLQELMRLATGDALDIDIPSYTAVVTAELLNAPPPTAVGYRVFVSYAKVDGDFVLLEPSLDAGGCDGLFASGAERTLSSQDRAHEGGTMRVGVIWELANGCGAQERIMSAR